MSSWFLLAELCVSPLYKPWRDTAQLVPEILLGSGQHAGGVAPKVRLGVIQTA